MKNSNNLSNNLKSYQDNMNYNLSEFSNELGIPRSTLQSILLDGNTTLDTLIRISNTLELSLDELVYGKPIYSGQSMLSCLLKSFSWYLNLSDEHRKEIDFHLNKIIEVVIP